MSSRIMAAFAIVCLGLASPAHAQVWPNEPAGAQVISDCQFAGTVCNWIDQFSTQQNAYVSDSSEPVSPPSVLDSYMPAGSTVGRGGWYQPLGNIRSIYMGVSVKMNADFIGNQGGAANKFWFARNPVTDNSFINWDGQSHQVYWYQQAQVDNCHIPGYSGNSNGYCWNAVGAQHDGTGRFYPNMSSGVLQPGSGWHRIEVCIVASSGAATKDGTLRWWLDGVLVGSYTGVNISYLGMTESNIDHTWDGFNTANRDTSKEWHWYIGHMKMSRPINGCGSGSVVPPTPTPPQPPPLPPNKPTNLRVQ